MHPLSESQLRHYIPSARGEIARLFQDGAFGAHTSAVARMLSAPRINTIELFGYGEEYLPHIEDLPHRAMATYFRMMSMLMDLSTPQRDLVLDAEVYCDSEPESLAIDDYALRQRFVWERSPELLEPFDE